MDLIPDSVMAMAADLIPMPWYMVSLIIFHFNIYLIEPLRDMDGIG